MKGNGNGNGATSIAVKLAGATGAGALVFVLAEAFVDSVKRDASIAIEQASQHGINMDSMRNEMAEMQATIAEFEAFTRQGGRYTKEEALQLEARVQRLESLFMNPQRSINE